jgi:hypothetical protein
MWLHSMIDLTAPESKEETVASLMAMPLIAAHTATNLQAEVIQFDRVMALRLAAETTAEFAAYDAATKFRQQLLTVSPGDEENRIELIRLLAANGKKDEAIQNLASTIADRNATRTLRWQAIWLTPEIVGSDSSLWVNVRDRVRSVSASDTEVNTALEALSLNAAGRADEAVKLITAAETSMPNEHLSSLRAIVEKKIGPAAALDSFSRATIAAQTPTVSKSFGFVEDEPLEQLISLYLKQDQPRAALKVAERVVAFQTNKDSVEQTDKAATVRSRSSDTIERYQSLRDRAERRERATHANLLALLSAAAEQVSDLNRAVEFEQLRLALLSTESDRKTTQARLDHLQQLQNAPARLRKVSLVVDQRLVASD